MASRVQGMEDVVATISGYRGSERFNLIKLISFSGASYVGAMSKAITHLVCWKFEGEKYNLAKKLNTILVNHRWFEECIKQGKRVPEGPYVSKSGQDVGPLTIETPRISKGDEDIPSCNKLLIHGDYEIENTDGGASDLDSWTESVVLKENQLNEFGENRSCKLKPRRAIRPFKWQNQPNEEHNHQEPRLSERVRKKKHRDLDNSLRSTRKKSNILDVSDSMMSVCLPESSRRGRRLVKKNACTEIVDLDSEKEIYISMPCQLSDRPYETQSLPEHINDGTSDIIHERADASGARHCSHNGATLRASKNFDVTETWNNSSDTGMPNWYACNASDTAESDVSGSIAEEVSEIQESEAPNNVTCIVPSVELSCVICWTEFSSTRGVLPCGHRFCYSCIQNWADHMASQRKTSTCPLCKASFVSITKVEDAESSDQKIYSQTIPCQSSSENIFVLTDQERLTFASQSLLSVCIRCLSREPEDLLNSCHLCNARFIHSYCMDPFLLPWICTPCKERQMLYHHSL